MWSDLESVSCLSVWKICLLKQRIMALLHRKGKKEMTRSANTVTPKDLWLAELHTSSHTSPVLALATCSQFCSRILMAQTFVCLRKLWEVSYEKHHKVSDSTCNVDFCCMFLTLFSTQETWSLDYRRSPEPSCFCKSAVSYDYLWCLYVFI